jgi:molybdopterin molybdotransferase
MMATLSHEEARRRVIETAGLRRRDRPVSSVALGEALGRILAEEIHADRDYPPFDRSTRDGFAVRSEDVKEIPRELKVLGEIRAGMSFAGTVGAGECVQIMTGAPVPAGADAVVMVEYTRAAGERITIERGVKRGENVVPRGSEARAGQRELRAGVRMGFAELAVAAQSGHARVSVYPRPRVAVLSTGDEVVAVDATPGPCEIRNSNCVSLAAQAELAGGEPVALGNAPDRVRELRAAIERGLEEDILVLSGGVSMGKYDLVEQVLKELGAEFFFDGVAIRPGKPAVFAVCHDKLVFGLPGNPVSTMVTFELLVSPAIDVLGGAEARPLGIFRAKLARDVNEKAKVTHFVPAKLSWDGGEAQVEALAWQGSGDIAALAEANCFLVVREDRLRMDAGEWAEVMPRRGML